uniref:Dimer_Tnp_hAT domain-containing protein n=1 Tax=Panagrellus redivivus TaxID=6233 RepID=A0A7E4W9S9_PANRE
MTLMAEGNSAIASIIPYLQVRIRQLCDIKTSNKVATKYMETFAVAIANREDEYKGNPIIEEATFFDPRFVHKTPIFPVQQWSRIKANVISKLIADDDIEPPSPSNPEEPDFWAPLQEATKETNGVEKEVEIYASLPKLDVPTPDHDNSSAVFRFWQTYKHQLPTLYNRAMEVLLVSASSAEPERVFSNLTNLLSNKHRANLKPSSIERTMTVRQHMAAEKMDRNLKKLDSGETDELSDDETYLAPPIQRRNSFS